MTARTVDVAGASVCVRCNGVQDALAFVFWHGLGHAGNSVDALARVSEGERMQSAVPHTDIRPIEGMRHAVFADLGASAGTLVADWLREQRLAGIA